MHSKRLLDFDEHTVILLYAHRLELLRAVIFIEHIVGMLLELFHMSSAEKSYQKPAM